MWWWNCVWSLVELSITPYSIKAIPKLLISKYKSLIYLGTNILMVYCETIFDNLSNPMLYYKVTTILLLNLTILRNYLRIFLYIFHLYLVLRYEAYTTASSHKDIKYVAHINMWAMAMIRIIGIINRIYFCHVLEGLLLRIIGLLSK